MKQIETAAIVGMGALGMLYGAVIQEAIGKERFAFVMDDKRYEKYNNKTWFCNKKEMSFSMLPSREGKPADLVIIAVKYPALSSAMDVAEPLIGRDTTILSVMNGISSEELLAERFGAEHLIMTVAQGMDAMHFKNELVYTRMGKLYIGVPASASGVRKERVEQVSDFFYRIGMPYVKEEDILYRMWAKYMLNVGVNQTCMVYECGYGKATTPGTEEMMCFVAAMREVVLLANLEGIGLSEKDVTQYIELMKTLDPKATPSMGQDRINRNPSEVEAFAGTILKLAKKHGIPAPANEFLYRRVKEIEKEYL